MRYSRRLDRSWTSKAGVVLRSNGQVFYDSVPVSAIVRIRDMMYTVKDPFRLDQGDVSFDAPDTFKQAVPRRWPTIAPTTCRRPAFRELRKAFAEKMRKRTASRSESTTRLLVTNGGTHGALRGVPCMLEPGDEVIIPEPEWPPTMAMVKAAGGVPVQVPLREELGWRWDLDEVENARSRRRRACSTSIRPTTRPAAS